MKMIKKQNKFSNKILDKKIQTINFLILLFCTFLSAVASLIPPIDEWFKSNNIYVMVCYTLALSIGLMIFAIFDHVYTIKPKERVYRPVKELGKLLSRLEDNLTVDIYFGLDNQSLLNQLIAFLSQHTTISKNYQIYINSNLVEYITDEKCFSEYRINLCCNLPNIILIYTNTPDAHSFFIRYTSQNEFEYISTSSNDEIISTLINSVIKQVRSIQLSDSFISQTMRYIFDTNYSSLNNLIDNKCLQIGSRDLFFKYMTDILSCFHSNIYAIDFIQPKHWLQHNYTREYGLAHRNLNGSIKQRIHIIDLDRICTLNNKDKSDAIRSYIEYAGFMRSECHVELFFLKLNDFDTTKYEKRGCLILNNECVFVAINPADGAPLGEIDFNPNKVTAYKERFNDCLSSAIPADDFINNILLKI